MFTYTYIHDYLSYATHVKRCVTFHRQSTVTYRRATYFQGFRGQLLNCENKHPLNFCIPRSTETRVFCCTRCGKMALWKYFKREVKTPLLAIYLSQYPRME